MVKTLYLARHGQTLFNLHHKSQGITDSPLTALGIKQAEITGQHFKDLGVNFDYRYSSTSFRAVKTLMLMSGQKPDLTLEELCEQNFGVYEAQDEYLRPRDGMDVTDAYYEHSGVEKTGHVQKRMLETITKLMDEAKDNTHTLIVGHGFANYTFNLFVSDYPKPAFGPHDLSDELAQKSMALFIPNAGYLKLTYDKGHFNFIERYDPKNGTVTDMTSFSLK